MIQKKNKGINFLISSAGRRVELIKIWRESIDKFFGNESKLYACDMNPNFSPACQYADEFFQICACDASNYSEILLKECIEKNIKIIIPTIDTELKVLAKARKYFELKGIEIIVSDLDLIESCINKNKTEDLFQLLNVQYPRRLDTGNLIFPCFKKPVIGNSGIGTKMIDSIDKLSIDDLKNENFIFQEYVDSSWGEFSIDLYYDRNSILKSCIPRKRLEVRNGEISKGLIHKNQLYYKILNDFNFLKGARGVITLQVFFKESFLNYLAIEINPRFGGGYPMSHYAGGTFPDLIIKEYILKEDIKFHDNWKNNYLFLRYDSTFMYENLNE
ncbi:ATP-grasp domain-containing protein [Prochlorococcus sp. AH-716-J21]|nr:ATP-grasp domain-containing protein [Prochlorococcus sp. AH-716-J21]